MFQLVCCQRRHCVSKMFHFCNKPVESLQINAWKTFLQKSYQYVQCFFEGTSIDISYSIKLSFIFGKNPIFWNWFFDIEKISVMTNHDFLVTVIPSWSPIDNQPCTALFQRFEVFSVLFQRTWKASELIKAVSELISSDFLWFRSVQNWRIQLREALFQRESVLNQWCSSLIFVALKHLIFGADSGLIYYESDLILTHVYENFKLW